MPRFPPPGTIEVIRLGGEDRAPPDAAWIRLSWTPGNECILITNMVTPQGRMPINGPYRGPIEAEDKGVCFAKEQGITLLYVETRRL